MRRPVTAGVLPDYDAIVRALQEEAAHAWELNGRAEEALVVSHVVAVADEAKADLNATATCVEAA